MALIPAADAMQTVTEVLLVGGFTETRRRMLDTMRDIVRDATRISRELAVAILHRVLEFLEPQPSVTLTPTPIIASSIRQDQDQAEEEDFDDDIPAGFQLFDLIKLLQTDRAQCHRWTGEHGWDCLVAMWEYLDADNAFSEGMIQLRTDSALAKGLKSLVGGRPTKLSPFYQFLFFKIVFRRLRGRGRIFIACAIFNIDVKVGRRYYVTWANAIARFSLGQQPPATRTQAAFFTPDKTKSELQLMNGEAAQMGDATERRVDSPNAAPLQSALWSEYK